MDDDDCNYRHRFSTSSKETVLAEIRSNIEGHHHSEHSVAFNTSCGRSTSGKNGCHDDDQGTNVCKGIACIPNSSNCGVGDLPHFTDNDDETCIVTNNESIRLKDSRPFVTNQHGGDRPQENNTRKNKRKSNHEENDRIIDYQDGKDDEDMMAPLFPMKLHELLEKASEMKYEHIVSWTETGNSFKVHDRDAFHNVVMPRFFQNQTKYKSFLRQLNLYKFCRVSSLKSDRGCYRHKNFVRGRQELCTLISRRRDSTIPPDPTLVGPDHHHHHQGHIVIQKKATKKLRQARSSFSFSDMATKSTADVLFSSHQDEGSSSTPFQAENKEEEKEEKEEGGGHQQEDKQMKQCLFKNKKQHLNTKQEHLLQRPNGDGCTKKKQRNTNPSTSSTTMTSPNTDCRMSTAAIKQQQKESDNFVTPKFTAIANIIKEKGGGMIPSRAPCNSPSNRDGDIIMTTTSTTGAMNEPYGNISSSSFTSDSHYFRGFSSTTSFYEDAIQEENQRSHDRGSNYSDGSSSTILVNKQSAGEKETKLVQRRQQQYTLSNSIINGSTISLNHTLRLLQPRTDLLVGDSALVLDIIQLFAKKDQR